MDRDTRHRRSIRLRGYDYTQAGVYFITVCVKHRACLFGDVVGGVMRGQVILRMHRGSFRKGSALRDQPRNPGECSGDFGLRPP